MHLRGHVKHALWQLDAQARAFIDMLAQLLCYMCSINLVIAPTADEPLERLNEADIKKAKIEANEAMSQLKIKLMFS